MFVRFACVQRYEKYVFCVTTKARKTKYSSTVSRSTLFVADSSWNRGQSWNIKERSCIWIWVKTLSPFAHLKINGNYGCASREVDRKLWNRIDNIELDTINHH